MEHQREVVAEILDLDDRSATSWEECDEGGEASQEDSGDPPCKAGKSELAIAHD